MITEEARELFGRHQKGTIKRSTLKAKGGAENCESDISRSDCPLI